MMNIRNQGSKENLRVKVKDGIQNTLNCVESSGLTVVTGISVILLSQDGFETITS